MRDKYKDPTNDKILKEISKKLKEEKKNFGLVSEFNMYRVGVYAGMNVTLRSLGREPL